MERNYFNEGFERFLREKSDEYKLYPSDKVWNNIHRKLHPRKKWPYLAAALLLLGIGVGTKLAVDESAQHSFNHIEQHDAASGGQPAGSGAEGSNPEGQTPDADRPEASSRRLKVASLNPEASVNPSSAPAMTALPGGQINTRRDDAATVITVDAPQASEALSPEASWTIQNRSMALLTPGNRRKAQFTLESPSRLEAFKKQIGNIGKRTSWQIYASPTVSYRNLNGRASKNSGQATGSVFGASMGFSTDVNDAVRHRPSIGMELGTALLYPVSKNFRIKAGLQFNYNNYLIEAFSYKPELATFSAAGPGAPRPVSTMSYYRNYNGYDKTTLQNKHFMISTPIGFELTVAGNDKLRFNVASTLQPTYVISNQSYLVSTNLKNYAQEPSLYRKWNMNAGMEAFLTVNSGSYSWVIGPQFRYQLFSSYKNKYPIQEHLLDLGFKVGVNKRLK